MRLLIIVSTPLHCIIAAKIISELNPDSYDLLVLCEPRAFKKIRAYRELSAAASTTIFFSRKLRFPKTISKVWKMLSLILIFYKRNYDILVTARHQDDWRHAIIDYQQKAQLITFDDGMESLNLDVNLKSDKRRKGLFGLVYHRFLRVTQASQFKRIFLHYSIYRDFSTIYDDAPKKYLNIINDSKKISTRRKIKVFIGQPFEQYLDNSDIKKLKKCSAKIGVNLYIPHPNEEASLIPDKILKNIEDKVAEEIIQDLLMSFDVEVISCFSSVIVNMIGSNPRNLSFTFLVPPSMREKSIYKNLIMNFIDKDNVTILHI